MGINKILVIFLIVASLFSCVGCSRNERDEIDASMDNEKHSLATTEPDGYNDGALEIIELREDPKDIYNQERLYGTWYIDSAVLKSEMYTGTTMDGWSEEDLYDPADYIGFEIEYSSQFFRLGTEKYNNPIYSVEKETLFGFNEGGDFKLPSFLQLIDEKEIDTKTVQIGNTVMLYDIEFDEEVEYTIVGSTEVDVAANKISNESPIGKALIGAKKGATVEVNAPAGIIKYEIRKITK